MREREIKFLVAEDFSLEQVDVGRRLRLTPAGETRYETVYVDTPDLRLAGWGCSLRHRSGQGWTLKLPPVRAGDSWSARRSRSPARARREAAAARRALGW